jgi:DNA-binding ferritin-like protein
MPDLIENHIENIQLKLNVLIKNYQALMVESKRLKRENEKLTTVHLELKETIAILEQQNRILKTSNGTMEGEEKKNFEKVINQYIKSIDKCMIMLNT